ncbi:YceI family protein [Rugamonas sp. DEMB1]|uniref:YceI family protein n=1 Tax=Rugamonas sp. DEMB1 TaxID=3039386 RepID=UPI00244BF6B2|nr:YceI family protein [Rugamonas sp. DEMB1]WGG48408.1 YceI family protein [Rugamonas sp. DEMB1]
MNTPTSPARRGAPLLTTALLLAALLNACAPLAPPPARTAEAPATPVAPSFPATAQPVPTAAAAPAPTTPGAADANMDAATLAPYQRARQLGQQVLSIAPGRSLIAVTVRRGGAFARFGHDHVVASRAVNGLVAPAAGLADFSFRLDQLSVDETELRAQAGLDTQPGADAIAGTRHNMLVKVLDAERYPLVQVHVERGAAAGAASNADADADANADVPLAVSITLHGVSRTLTIPVRIEREHNTLRASGTARFKQSDFGIVPYSLMGGALAVQDQLELRFELVALAP